MKISTNPNLDDMITWSIQSSSFLLEEVIASQKGLRIGELYNCPVLIGNKNLLYVFFQLQR